MSTRDLDMPILSGHIARRAADDARLLAFGSQVGAGRPTMLIQNMSDRLQRRYSAISAPGILAGMIAQRFVSSEQTAPNVDLLLPRPTRSPAVARWAARWPDTPVPRTHEPMPDAAQPNLAPGTESLLHDLDDHGWGRPDAAARAPVRGSGARERGPGLRAAQPIRRAAQAESVSSASVSGPDSLGLNASAAPPADGPEGVSTEVAPASVVSQTDGPKGANTEGAQASVAPVDAGTDDTSTPTPPATADVARVFEPPATADVAGGFEPSAEARPSQASALPSGPATDAGTGTVDRSAAIAPAPANLAAIDLTLLRPAGLRTTALMRQFAPDPLARMGFSPTATPIASAAPIARDSAPAVAGSPDMPLSTPPSVGIPPPFEQADLQRLPSHTTSVDRWPDATMSGPPDAPPAFGSVDAQRSQAEQPLDSALPPDAPPASGSVDAQRSQAEMPAEQPLDSALPPDALDLAHESSPAGTEPSDSPEPIKQDVSAEPEDVGTPASTTIDRMPELAMATRSVIRRSAGDGSGTAPGSQAAIPSPARGRLVPQTSAPRLTPLHFSELLLQRMSASAAGMALSSARAARSLPSSASAQVRQPIGAVPEVSRSGAIARAALPAAPMRSPQAGWPALTAGAANLPLAAPDTSVALARFADPLGQAAGGSADQPIGGAISERQPAVPSFTQLAIMPDLTIVDRVAAPEPFGFGTFAQQPPLGNIGEGWGMRSQPSMAARSEVLPVARMPYQLARYAADNLRPQHDDGAYAGAAPAELPLATPAALMVQRASEQIQRADEPVPADAAAAAQPAGHGQPPAAPDDPRQIERMANQVYEHLRRRLLIDHERRGWSM